MRLERVVMWSLLVMTFLWAGLSYAAVAQLMWDVGIADATHAPATGYNVYKGVDAVCSKRRSHSRQRRQRADLCGFDGRPRHDGLLRSGRDEQWRGKPAFGAGE